ncbi:MarR family transcriptional regulator [Massilia sp. R2A-15]|uniref:MarR family winged helix-turn-helix transcriptional regulator n=1 Tax=Massilia sp. R2A-15 TaxID=3064278 RepID=UPI002733501B|nr:MarR family transcriptional regulator [Massilia sp. R2A-15]WLI91194.1 MarR family transcriptional regulator [Massilia sp. R2A-15]
MPSDLPTPTPDPGTDQAGRVLRQFRIVFNAVKVHFRQVETAAGIGGAQVWALSVIRSRPGVGVSELGRSMDVHQSTASNLVKVLLERGMVRAVKDTEDRRALGLHLTEAGAAVLEAAPAPFSGILPGALAGLEPDTLARLETDLDALINALQADRAGGKVLLADL